ncbi:MAG: hypothetical protein PHS30_11685, partial [Bacteroidales bacterium]|nr:hypothetical protein [Bacteroidales bacterium]
MDHFKTGRLFVLIFVMACGHLFAALASPIVFRSGKAEISFKDHLQHEFFWWPNTLLSYPVVFEEAVVAEGLILTDMKSGKQVPFQLTGLEKTSDGKMNAVLYLMTAMSPGGEFHYILKKGNPETFQKIKIEQKG